MYRIFTNGNLSNRAISFKPLQKLVEILAKRKVTNC